MPNSEREPSEVAEDLFRRLDPGGKLSEHVRAFSPLVSSRLGRGFLRLLGVDSEELDRLIGAPQGLIGSMTEAFLVFAPVGWAPSSRTPVEPFKQALQIYRDTQSLEQAESILVDAWNEPDRLRWALKPLGSLGAAHGPLGDAFWRRSLLVDKALKHHVAGAYEASVPIILSQIDGIVWDLTEGKAGFFTGGKQATHLVDSQTVAGLPEGLELLRQLVGQSVRETRMTGQLTRHGIMHGRELGYDTCINSTKALVLLLAVVDWAQPRARELADRRHAEHEAMYAGSDSIDERGRRLDRRDFDRAQESLRNLNIRQIAEFRRNGRYGNDLDALFPGTARENDYLRNKAQVTLRTTDDRQGYWAWRSTPSGFCFGIAAQGGPPGEWLYAGPRPPEGGIDSIAGWRGLRDSPPPDWR